MTPKKIYLHGLPGANSELAALGIDALADDVFPVSRLKFLDRAASYETYLHDLTQWIAGTWPKTPIHLIGFSMGAMTALRLIGRPALQVVKVDLISPAAPLETGGHLDGMAGKAVFKAAMQHRSVIAALSHVQAGLHKVSPSLFYRMLFSDIAGYDHGLSKDPRFQHEITQAMGQALRDYRRAYVKETLEYVSLWSRHIQPAQVPVTLWHGSEDTWAPPAMSQTLAQLLGAQADVRPCEDHAHFSTLGFAMTEICRGD